VRRCFGGIEALNRYDGADRQLRETLASAAVVAERVGLTGGDGQQRIVAEAVVIIEVFIADGETKDTLGDQVLDGVLDGVRVAAVLKAATELAGQAE
jgi:hypothetical protein